VTSKDILKAVLGKITTCETIKKVAVNFTMHLSQEREDAHRKILSH
jgi:hypothetical protein